MSLAASQGPVPAPATASAFHGAARPRGNGPPASRGLTLFNQTEPQGDVAGRQTLIGILKEASIRCQDRKRRFPSCKPSMVLRPESVGAHLQELAEALRYGTAVAVRIRQYSIGRDSPRLGLSCTASTYRSLHFGGQFYSTLLSEYRIRFSLVPSKTVRSRWRARTPPAGPPFVVTTPYVWVYPSRPQSATLLSG